MEQGLLVSCLDAPNINDAVRRARGLGYRNCEISVCPEDKRPNLVNLSNPERHEVLNLVNELGMKISSLQCHIHNGYADAAKETRTRAVEHTKRMMELSSSLGVDILHVVSGVAEDCASEDEKIDRVAACCREILKEAGPGAPRLALEPVFVYVIGNLSHTRKLYKRLGNLPLYVNFDPSHFPYHDESPVPFIREFGRLFIHAHSKDARVEAEPPADISPVYPLPDGRRKFYFVPPGEGVLVWDELIAEMEKIGFTGVLSLEMGHGYHGTPTDNARQTYHFFRNKYNLS